jgi:hypothetical protein
MVFASRVAPYTLLRKADGKKMRRRRRRRSRRGRRRAVPSGASLSLFSSFSLQRRHIDFGSKILRCTPKIHHVKKSKFSVWDFFLLCKERNREFNFEFRIPNFSGCALDCSRSRPQTSMHGGSLKFLPSILKRREFPGNAELVFAVTEEWGKARAFG